jgi:flagellar hook-associated protein 1 FlgK
MSINRLYEMSRRSFGVFSAQMNVAGQNIANANTPGYARRRLTLGTEGPGRNGLLMPNSGGVGSGVTAQRLERMRDGLLATAANDARTGLGGADEETRLLATLEGSFGVGSGASLQDVMSGFWNGWSDLANNPTDGGVRSTLLGQADTLAATLRRLDDGITRLAGETQTALGESVGQVNGLLDEIAGLNASIRASRAAGLPDFAAEDRRDAAVAELSAFAPVRVSDGSDGYTVTINGMAAVQGDQALGLTLDVPPDVAVAGVRFEGTDVAFSPSSGGSLGAQLKTLQKTLPDTRAALVADVNAAHGAGYGLDGSTGLNFFDPAGVTAGSIRLSDDVSDPAAIAASGAPDAPGDSSVASALAALREGFDTQAIDITAGVGGKLRAARSAAGAQAAIVDHLAAMEAGVSGVSVDEEMTNLIEAQHAFAAAARVLTTADEMMQTLLSL